MSGNLEYPDDEHVINKLMTENRHLYEVNGVSDYANETKSMAQNAANFWKKATSTKLGLAISIVLLIIVIMICTLIIMGFGNMLSADNPFGIVKVVIMLGLLVGTYFLLM
jgi:ABC-type uncharacterized transport system fused permease/ATPase subunit